MKSSLRIRIVRRYIWICLLLGKQYAKNVPEKIYIEFISVAFNACHPFVTFWGYSHQYIQFCPTVAHLVKSEVAVDRQTNIDN